MASEVGTFRRIDQGGEPPTDVRAGAAIYNPLVLAFYDAMVIGFANQYAWRCPTRTLLDWYQAHVSSNHLELGVGTGYYLDRCRFPSEQPRLVLADLNANALRKTARRVDRYRPTAYQLNVLAPFKLPEERFDSIAVSYVLHCLPGTLSKKAVAFDHLLPLLNPGGVLFGSTILSIGVELNALARSFLAFYNRLGVINNAGDNLGELETSLRSRFPAVELRVVGSVALFSGSIGVPQRS
jgi:ubiquinone/menaquinone biosynthesis C-methylase UbiE